MVFQTLVQHFENPDKIYLPTSKQEGAEILLDLLRKLIRGPRHPDSNLAVQVGIRLSPSCTDSAGPSEAQPVVWPHPPDCTLVVEGGGGRGLQP